VAIALSQLGGIAAAARPSQANPTPAGDWARSLCGALVNWRNDVEHAATDTTNENLSDRKLSASAKVKKAKQEIVKFVGVAIDATNAAESNVRAVGAPPVSNGADVEDALLASFDELLSFLQSSRDQAQAVSAKDAKRAQRKERSIEGGISIRSNEVESVMDLAIAKDTSGELRGTIAMESQCADVLGGQT
jgi:hypothetical protein